jgi:hypothetical protein
MVRFLLEERKTYELFLYAGITGTENPAAMQDHTIHGRWINLEILNHPGFNILIKQDGSLTNPLKMIINGGLDIRRKHKSWERWPKF